MHETLYGHLRAEALRLRGSASAWFSLLGLLIGVLSILLSGGTRAAGFESAVFSWQVMYFTGMAAPLMMVLAALQESRDKNARLAGLQWRGTNPRYEQCARLVGASLVALVFQVLSYGSIILFGGAPMGRGLIGLAFSWIGALGYLCIGAIVARSAGIVGALVAGIAWQILGGVFAESPLWWLVPAAWPIRILLEPTGVNFNGTPIDPSSPVLNDSPILGPLLCLLLALSVGIVACFTATRSDDRQRGFGRKLRRTAHREAAVEKDHSAESFDISAISKSGVRQIRRFPLPAVFMTLRGSGVAVMTAAAATVIVFASISYVPSMVSQIVTFFIFPVGVGLLPILTWRAFAPGYIPLHLHNRAVTPVFTFVHVLIIGVLVAVLAVSLLFGGMLAGEVGIRVALWILIGTALAGIALALAIRFGPAAPIAALVVWTIVGITLGGDVLSETYLWLLAVTAWPEIGLSAQRLPVALILAVGLAMVGLVAADKALARARRDS